LITPVEELSISPGGSDPVAVQFPYGGTPPAALSVCEYETPTVPLGSDVVEIDTGDTMIARNVFGAVPAVA
jgi:hypothetical protein